MKPGFIILISFLSLQLTFSPDLSAQKTLKIDEQLKSNSQLMPVKRKGVSTIGKYEFGSYKVISGKAGWEKTTSKSPLFGDHTSINSSSNKSFVFINNETDTCIANIRVVEDIETDDGNWFSRTFLNYSDSEIKKGEGVYEAVFSYSADTVLWSLVVVYPLAIEVDGNFKVDSNIKFRGILTDTNSLIEIKEVTESDDGKNSFLNPVMGYEFWQDSKSLAAVQVMPPNKMYVWIRDDLDNNLKFVLASGITALLVNTF